MARDGFIFHFEYMDYLEELSAAEQCQIIQAMVVYSQNGEDTTFEDRTQKDDAVKRKPPNAFRNFEQRDINLDDFEAQLDRQFVEGAMQ